MTVALSALMVLLGGFQGSWFVYLLRFVILFSSIIPIRSVVLLPCRQL